MPAVLEKTLVNGDAKRLARILRPFAESSAYVAKNYQALLAKHPEQWIAAGSSGIVASAATRRELVKKLRDAQVKGADLDIIFLTKKKHTLIL